MIIEGRGNVHQLPATISMTYDPDNKSYTSKGDIEPIELLAALKAFLPKLDTSKLSSLEGFMLEGGFAMSDAEGFRFGRDLKNDADTPIELAGFQFRDARIDIEKLKQNTLITLTANLVIEQSTLRFVLTINERDLLVERVERHQEFFPLRNIQSTTSYDQPLLPKTRIYDLDLRGGQSLWSQQISLTGSIDLPWLGFKDQEVNLILYPAMGSRALDFAFYLKSGEIFQMNTLVNHLDFMKHPLVIEILKGVDQRGLFMSFATAKGTIQPHRVEPSKAWTIPQGLSFGMTYKLPETSESQGSLQTFMKPGGEGQVELMLNPYIDPLPSLATLEMGDGSETPHKVSLKEGSPRNCFSNEHTKEDEKDYLGYLKTLHQNFHPSKGRHQMGISVCQHGMAVDVNGYIKDQSLSQTFTFLTNRPGENFDHATFHAGLTIHQKVDQDEFNYLWNPGAPDLEKDLDHRFGFHSNAPRLAFQEPKGPAKPANLDLNNLYITGKANAWSPQVFPKSMKFFNSYKTGDVTFATQFPIKDHPLLVKVSKTSDNTENEQTHRPEGTDPGLLPNNDAPVYLYLHPDSTKHFAFAPIQNTALKEIIPHLQSDLIFTGMLKSKPHSGIIKLRGSIDGFDMSIVQEIPQYRHFKPHSKNLLLNTDLKKDLKASILLRGDINSSPVELVATYSNAKKAWVMEGSFRTSRRFEEDDVKESPPESPQSHKAQTMDHGLSVPGLQVKSGATPPKGPATSRHQVKARFLGRDLILEGVQDPSRSDLSLTGKIDQIKLIDLISATHPSLSSELGFLPDIDATVELRVTPDSGYRLTSSFGDLEILRQWFKDATLEISQESKDHEPTVVLTGTTEIKGLKLIHHLSFRKDGIFHRTSLKSEVKNWSPIIPYNLPKSPVTEVLQHKDSPVSGFLTHPDGSLLRDVQVSKSSLAKIAESTLVIKNLRIGTRSQFKRIVHRGVISQEIIAPLAASSTEELGRPVSAQELTGGGGLKVHVFLEGDAKIYGVDATVIIRMNLAINPNMVIVFDLPDGYKLSDSFPAAFAIGDALTMGTSKHKAIKKAEETMERLSFLKLLKLDEARFVLTFKRDHKLRLKRGLTFMANSKINPLNKNEKAYQFLQDFVNHAPPGLLQELSIGDTESTLFMEGHINEKFLLLSQFRAGHDISNFSVPFPFFKERKARALNPRISIATNLAGLTALEILADIQGRDIEGMKMQYQINPITLDQIGVFTGEFQHAFRIKNLTIEELGLALPGVTGPVTFFWQALTGGTSAIVGGKVKIGGGDHPLILMLKSDHASGGAGEILDPPRLPKMLEAFANQLGFRLNILELIPFHVKRAYLRFKPMGSTNNLMGIEQGFVGDLQLEINQKNDARGYFEISKNEGFRYLATIPGFNIGPFELSGYKGEQGLPAKLKDYDGKDPFIDIALNTSSQYHKVSGMLKFGDILASRTFLDLSIRGAEFHSRFNLGPPKQGVALDVSGTTPKGKLPKDLLGKDLDDMTIGLEFNNKFSDLVTHYVDKGLETLGARVEVGVNKLIQATADQLRAKEQRDQEALIGAIKGRECSVKQVVIAQKKIGEKETEIIVKEAREEVVNIYKDFKEDIYEDRKIKERYKKKKKCSGLCKVKRAVSKAWEWSTRTVTRPVKVGVRVVKRVVGTTVKVVPAVTKTVITDIYEDVLGPSLCVTEKLSDIAVEEAKLAAMKSKKFLIDDSFIGTALERVGLSSDIGKTVTFLKNQGLLEFKQGLAVISNLNKVVNVRKVTWKGSAHNLRHMVIPAPYVDVTLFGVHDRLTLDDIRVGNLNSPNKIAQTIAKTIVNRVGNQLGH